jgi:WS/DGAT/MGAT family acyltransferase
METTEVHVSNTDAFTWNMEADPLLRSTIVAVTRYASAPDWDRLLDRVERATRLQPTFRSLLRPTPFGLATPRWQLDPDFDLDWHVQRVAAASPGAFDDVLHLARQMGMQAFDPARPLWQFTLVEDLDDGGAALILKVHHSLTDGIGGIQISQHVVDLDPDVDPSTLGPLPPVPRTSPVPFGALGRTAEAVAWDVAQFARVGRDVAVATPRAALATVRDPLGAARSVGAAAGSAWRTVRPISTTLSPVMRERRLQWHYDTLDVPLAGLKAAGAAAGGTVNDAFLAGVTGGLRRYHEAHDADVDELRLTMPISIRSDTDAEGGNHVTLARFAVPVGIVDPIARMTAIDELCGAQRREPAMGFVNAIAGVLNLLPSPIIGGMLKHVDFLASNVPGLDIPVWLAGAPLQAFYAFGPTLGSSANITLMSYAGTCNIGITTDAGAITDPDRFTDCLRAGFAEVLAVGESS